MSFLTLGPGGRLQTDDSTEFGESGMQGIFSGIGKKLKAFHKKHKKLHMKIASYVNPVFIHKRHIEMIKKKLAKRKHKKSKGGGGGGGGGDRWKWAGGKAGDVDAEGHVYGSVKTEGAAATEAALAPAETTPAEAVITTPGPMSPVQAGMQTPFYGSGGGGGGGPMAPYPGPDYYGDGGPGYDEIQSEYLPERQYEYAEPSEGYYEPAPPMMPESVPMYEERVYTPEEAAARKSVV